MVARVDLINLTQDMAQGLAVIYTIMILRVPYKGGIS
jgi:hypothetical protein